MTDKEMEIDGLRKYLPKHYSDFYIRTIWDAADYYRDKNIDVLFSKDLNYCRYNVKLRNGQTGAIQMTFPSIEDFIDYTNEKKGFEEAVKIHEEHGFVVEVFGFDDLVCVVSKAGDTWYPREKFIEHAIKLTLDAERSKNNMPYRGFNYPLSASMICDDIIAKYGAPRNSRRYPWRTDNGSSCIPGVVRVDTYNNRVTKVTFADGSFTKSICSPNDTFDIDVGITICIMKRMLGKSSDDANRAYANLIRTVHKTMDKREKEKQKAAEAKKEARERQRKAELKNAAAKIKAKEEQIDIVKQGMMRAHQSIGDDGR